MKYALTMALMGGALLLGAFAYPTFGIVFTWSAISFFVVALRYGGLGPKVFGKRDDGTIFLPLKVLNLPFLLYTWAVWHIYRLLSREDAFNVISDDLVVGRRLLSSEIPDGFDHYVDLTAEFEEPLLARSSSSYRSFPILDASVPSMEDLKSAVELLESGRTYVHCAQGHGRTGVFALALLHQRGKIKGVEDGVALLKSLRPAINLNREQTGFISRYLTQAQPESS